MLLWFRIWIWIRIWSLDHGRSNPYGRLLRAGLMRRIRLRDVLRNIEAVPRVRPGSHLVLAPRAGEIQQDPGDLAEAPRTGNDAGHHSPPTVTSTAATRPSWVTTYSRRTNAAIWLVEVFRLPRYGLKSKPESGVRHTTVEPVM